MLLTLVELVDHWLELTLMTFLVLSKLLSHLSHSFFVSLKLSLRFLLLTNEVLELFLLLGKDHLIASVLFDEFLLLSCKLRNRFITSVDLRDVVFHVVPDLNV